MKKYLKQVNEILKNNHRSSLLLALLLVMLVVIDVAPAEDTKQFSEVNPVYVSVHAKDNTTFSSENSATVVNIPYRSGDAFKKGEILIEFDCRVAKAELKKALAQQEAADSAHYSTKKLKTYDSASEQELIKARTDADIASAEVDKLKAIVDKCIVKAPYDGKVSEVMIHVGESVKPGEALLKVVNTSNLELQLQIPSQWLTWLYVGAEFKITIDEIHKTLSAKVSKINPEIDPVSQTLKIIGVLTNPEPLLLPGMSGQAVFSKETIIKEANKNNKAANPIKDKEISTTKKITDNAGAE